MGLSSLGGLSGLGTGGRLSLAGSGEGGGIDGIHLTVGRRITHALDANRSEVTWEGPWEDLVQRLNEIGVGNADNGSLSDLPDGESDTSGNYGARKITSAVLTRGPGGVGRLAVTCAQNVHAVLFGLDWVEVSKPIRTWRADRGENAPDLGKIRKWEDSREGSPDAYYGFKVGGEEMEGSTRKLASFIARGIESYPRYAPVLTMQLVVQGPQAAWEAKYRVGTVGDPTCPLGWTDPAGRSAEDFLAGVLDPEDGTAYTWLLVKSVLSPRPDGCFTWNLAWQGADGIDTDLYGSEDGS